uniref:PiggyBac transposable element-derived protein domain-containing protein n=1 Tax=Phytophthora ramorum TaxID=164328 RepID=H3GV95_PHYRM
MDKQATTKPQPGRSVAVYSARVQASPSSNRGDAEMARAAQVVQEIYGDMIESAGAPSDDPRAPPSTPVHSLRSTRPTRRSLAVTESPMALTPPPRSSQPTFQSSGLISTSPHIGDESAVSMGDDADLDETFPPDDASVASAEEASEYEPPGDASVESAEEESENDHAASEADDVDDSNVLLVDKGDTLNDVDEGEVEADYGAMESGDDGEMDDLFDGEDSDDDCAETYLDEDGDDPEATEAEITAEELFAERFLDSFGGEERILDGNLKKDVEGPNVEEYLRMPYVPVDTRQTYPGLRQGYAGPTVEALRNANSPVVLFFFFLPVVLWQHSAVCSNQLGSEMTTLRVDERYNRYRMKHRLQPDLPKKTKRNILTELEGKKSIQPHELCRFVGLLIARTIAPNHGKLSHHWKTTDEGSIPRGAVGSVLRRDRFMEISRNLHFNPNGDPRATTDRAWKIRKVVEMLQRTFERGYVAPSHLAFDEAMLPSRSSFNKMRVYMKDKPHKWGTKLFILSVRRPHTPFDARKQGMRLVVVDRFYTSVALAIQLLLMGFYCVGTIMTHRLGYCKGVIEKKKSRPATIARGSFKCVKSKLVPNMAVISWWDSRPVHFLCTGGSLELDRVFRQDRVDKVEVPCPRVVKDYHAFMGGVNVHDQLRLQRYSIQRAVRFRKYYTSLVLGLIDMAIVNGYIVHRAFHKHNTSLPLTHVKYMKKLHLQLCQMRTSDMYKENTFGAQEDTQQDTPTTASAGADQTTHTHRQLNEWRDRDTQPKRRQRSCKICSLLRVGDKRSTTASFFCDECSEAGPIFLCMKPHRQIRGVAITCWDICHREWVNGKLIPADTGRSIRVHPSHH